MHYTTIGSTMAVAALMASGANAEFFDDFNLEAF